MLHSFVQMSFSLSCLFSFITSFFMTLVAIPIFFRIVKKIKLTEKIKVITAVMKKQTRNKQDTPTMGGVVMVICSLISVLLWGHTSNSFLLLAILIVLFFSFLGMADDLIKTYTVKKGLSTFNKLLFSGILAAISIYFLLQIEHFPSYLYIPFWQKKYIAFGFEFAFLFLIVVSTCHAVNLTDGIDGLATVNAFAVLLFFTFSLYVSIFFVDYNNSFDALYAQQMTDIIIFNFSLMGSLLAFLIFNSFPATIFMGDCGALMLGAYIGYVSILAKQELLLLFVGFIFIIETLSSMVRIFSKKYLRKPLLLCAPLHHHLRAKGWHENKVVMVFFIWQVFIILVVILWEFPHVPKE